ncbi:hypothetical protein [Lactobacillus bombicola]|uniref:hypothetical protein n=1 Tax=Lactobacillus bombicola TaxID=1505723 RepID=UPI000E56A26E|nr:hypothetical protein [Lactobacillus bombicola]RHW48683.1 hypothetical protein DS833_07500 [Lactobacillus bombicola]
MKISTTQAQTRIRQLLNRDKQDSSGTEYDYRQALLIIANHLNAFITEYGDKNGLDPTQVNQKINNWDLQQWKQAVSQVTMSELSPDARARYRYYSQTAGINRNYLISAIIGVAFLASTQKQETRVSNRIDLDVGDVKKAYKVTKKRNKQTNKAVAENYKKWSSDLWLKNDAMVAQVQSAVNKHLSSTLTHRDITKMFDYSNARSQSVQAVKAMTSSTIRLLRTETARATHEIMMSAFKVQHVAMVEMVVEPDVCPKCDEIREQGPFNLDNVPDIPIHPNCRCSLIPYDGDVAMSF